MKLPDIKKTIESFKKLNASQKKLLVASATLVFVCLALIIILAATKNISAVSLECYGSEKMSTLVALDSNAQSGTIKQSDYANFKFTEKQKELFKEIYQQNSTVALTVRLLLKPTKKQAALMENSDIAVFRFGFLDSNDFSSKGKFIKQFYPDNKRILVSGKEKNAPQSFDISFAIQKNDDIEKVIPQGFFIYSTVRCKVVAACVVPAELGFDLTSQVPFYGFACNGGIVDFTNSDFDFSGASMLFPVQNSNSISMPEFVFNLYDNDELNSTYERSVRAEINIGGEKLFIKNVKPAREIVIPSAALKAPFSSIKLLANKECLASVILRATHIAGKEVLKPVRTDPGLILNYSPKYWRTLDYEIFEWDRYPGIIFFDTRNYDVQDNFFRRMAYFVEKAGYKGRLLTNGELKGKHGYNAHDYSSQSMANFFNKATELGFELNDEEEGVRCYLALCYLDGCGVDKDINKAKQLLEEEIGLSNGQYSNLAKDKLKEISSTSTSKENYTDKELKAFYDYLRGQEYKGTISRFCLFSQAVAYHIPQSLALEIAKEYKIKIV